ncbi:unnamed protein product [Cuscuta epithymum]|uniref:Uncharacterized protein n=1 Tax=Cuscuta epithymum TaxID=186058 RepID=A0AAV0DGT4_9ASTE|nr:unnamed protein product [Cuscuta epithymum]
MPILNEGTEYAANLIAEGSPFWMGHYVSEDGLVMLTFSSGGEKMTSRLERLAAKAGSTPGALVRKVQTRGSIEAALGKSGGGPQRDGTATLAAPAADLRPPLRRGPGRG